MARQDKPQESDRKIATWQKAIEIDPHNELAYRNLASAWAGQEKWEEAISAYAEAIAIRHEYADLHYPPEKALVGTSNLDEAFNYYQQTLELEAEYARAYLNLGHVFSAQDKAGKAIAAYRKALEIYPDYAEAHVNIGGIAYQQGNLNEAVASFEAALAIDPNYVEAHCNLGSALAQMSLLDEAINCYERALAINPDMPEIAQNLNRIYLRLVPRWHFPMMNDRHRNDCYNRALRKAIRSDSIVLDIGAGSGLLAMMAARAGAKHVTSCEKVKPVADMASKIVKLNGFSQQITVVNKISTDLEIGTDMPAKANILVSEIVDVGLLAEGVVPSVAHARANLLAPDAKILPKAATVYGMLVESEKLYAEDRVQTAAGFDLSPFNDFSSKYTYLQNYLSHFPHRVLSEVFEVFAFDFCGASIQPATKEIQPVINDEGKCHAIVFWFRLWLDDEIFIDTSPMVEDTCWMQAIQLLPSPLELVKGDSSIKILAQHNCNYITFQISG
ncbi:tetratricopeptide repeat protein [Pseudanabaena sp. PCC 6802]|uniref:tetratricopeptide repeat protein n=1 Tax=Pseudanabaena sp. PCC 6802 TaxID=118173 RepID=UPI000349B95B|nr:tetratricopeptide repeat protein [Pseudanabaena sp. PCC 6802]